MLIIEKPGTYLSITEVAKLRGVSASTVKVWLKRGLPSIKGRGTMGHLILKEDAEEFYISNRPGKPLTKAYVHMSKLTPEERQEFTKFLERMRKPQIE